jgi:two-component system OmpR family sensor kinase
LNAAFRATARLSIFGRTFLFMVIALAAAEGIEISLQFKWPPMHSAPVRLSQIAQRLRKHDSSFPQDRLPGPGAVPGGRKSLDEDRGHSASGADLERIAGDALQDAVEPPPDPTLHMHRALSPPAAPKRADMAVSQVLRGRLASVLGVPLETVQIYVGPNDLVESTGNAEPWDVSLRDGFSAARRLSNGQWLVIESIVESFPTAFQRQAMLLFALGVLVLLPLAWIFATALAAPIRRFSEAAKRLGKDPGAPPLPRTGPAEMLDAVDSFNAMQGRLNRLLQERTQMVGAIAHDLRTPLTRLAFRLEDLTPNLRDKVYADIQEMKMMISAALDFIRDRTLSARHERLDFRLLVESVVDDQNDLGNDVTLQSGEAMTLEGDPLALKRVVVNLVDNAVKYGERARLRLRKNNGFCTLEIDDDGPGIAPELQQRVFQPFFRLETSRNRDTGGIGLGLSTVQSIMVDHGGEISLRNRKDGGLRATVTLPTGAK